MNKNDVPMKPVLIDNCGSNADPIPHVAIPMSQHPGNTMDKLMELPRKRLEIPSSDDEDDNTISAASGNKTPSLQSASALRQDGASSDEDSVILEDAACAAQDPYGE